MKALLLIETDSAFIKIRDILKKMGVETVRYRLPQKAMDNIDEISPQIIIISAADFPRHWKVLLQFLNGFIQETPVPVILIKNRFFSETEADKALFLKVKAIVEDSLEGESLRQITEIILRYKPEALSLTDKAVCPTKEMPVQCIFSNPINNQIITGQVTSLSHKEIFFTPDSFSSVKGMETPVEVTVLIKIGKNKIKCPSRVVLHGKHLRITFSGSNSENSEVIEEYLTKNLYLCL